MTDISAISSNATDASQSVDHSYAFRDTQSGSNQGVGEMGFDDFLDMVNPLQHIPLVSSIYRAATGENINPVSRIAGDALYGGVFGLASAGLSAIGAAADEAVASLSGGKSASGMVVAALFGDDNDTKSVQLAANDSGGNTAGATATPQSLPLPATDMAMAAASVAQPAAQPASQPAMQTASLLQSPARQSPILQIPDLSVAAQTASAAPSASAASTAAPAAIFSPAATATASIATNISPVTYTTANTPGTGANGMPLDRSKQAYGGVMDPAMMQNAIQNQSLALALMSGQENLQAQHSIRNSRFSTSGASPTTAPTAQSASLPLPGSTPSLTSWSGNNNTNSPAAVANALNPGAAVPNLPANAQAALGQNAAATAAAGLPASLRASLPQTGSNDLKPIKGLNQYRATAQKVPANGTVVDTTN